MTRGLPTYIEIQQLLLSSSILKACIICHFKDNVSLNFQTITLPSLPLNISVKPNPFLYRKLASKAPPTLKHLLLQLTQLSDCILSTPLPLEEVTCGQMFVLVCKNMLIWIREAIESVGHIGGTKFQINTF